MNQKKNNHHQIINKSLVQKWNILHKYNNIYYRKQNKKTKKCFIVLYIITEINLYFILLLFFLTKIRFGACAVRKENYQD